MDKTCTITEDEIRELILFHARQTMYGEIDYAIERINYLNKRLKAKPKEVTEEAKNEEETSTAANEKVGW